MLHEGIRGGWPRNEGSDGGILGQIVESGPRSELGPEPDPDGTAQDTPAIQEERSSGVTMACQAMFCWLAMPFDSMWMNC